MHGWQSNDPEQPAPPPGTHRPSDTLTVPPELAGQPIEQLVRRLAGPDGAAQVCAHGGVWLNGRRVPDVRQPAHTGAHLEVHYPPGGHYADVTITPDDICYEDAWLLALNKRAGWYSTPTPWDNHNDIRTALTRFLHERDRRDGHDGQTVAVHLAHQLDRDTTGVLLCAKDSTANAPLQAAFASGAVQKTYCCICCGEPPDDVFELRTGHGRMKGRWGIYPLEQVGMLLPNGKRVRVAHTSFVVERRIGTAALLRATPHTGRTHQIRLHLEAIGCPLPGDTRYGGPAQLHGSPVPYHLLHAASLGMPHPMTGAWLEMVAPLPEHMVTVLAHWEQSGGVV